MRKDQINAPRTGRLTLQDQNKRAKNRMSCLAIRTQIDIYV